MMLHRGQRVAWLTAALFIFGPWLRPAAAQLLGPELLVNSFTTSTQQLAKVAADDAGNFVVVWESTDQDGSNEGIFAQRFNATANPVGSEIQVNSFTTGRQRYAAVAAAGPGNFVVVWQSDSHDGSDYGVFGQRFDSAGNPAGSEFQVNTFTTGAQKSPAVATDAAGNFVVAWNDQTQVGYGIFARRFDSVGAPAGDEFRASSTTNPNEGDPAVAMDDAGNFLVTWHDSVREGSDTGVFGRRFDPAGNPAGSEFQVNSFTTGYQWSSAVAADGAGNFVVVWISDLQDGAGYGLFGQRYDSAGSPAGSEFPVNSYTTSNQYWPAVAADGSGNFAVTWHSDGQDLSALGVFAQRFNSAGARVESELQINDFTTNGQRNPAVAADGAGNFVVAWHSNGQDGAGLGIVARQMTTVVFAGAPSSFEAGNVCDWDSAVGSSDICLP